MESITGPRRRIAIVYHSGTGGTRMVARLVGEALGGRFDVSVRAVEEKEARETASGADFIALFHPTYFLRPSPSTMEFIENLGAADPPRPAYVVATYELYSENAIRATALALGRHGFVVVGSKAVRAPGSDVTCVLPARAIPWLYRFEPTLPRKIARIAAEIEEFAMSELNASAIPARKWYTSFAQALQVLALNHFAAYRERFRVLSERCSSCGACLTLCHRGAWSMAKGVPRHTSERCELCMRCVHRCPKRAIVLVTALKDNPRLDARLYVTLETEARLALDSAARGGKA
jgi:ferredoxin